MTNAWTLHIDDEWIAWLTFDLQGEKVNKLTAAALVELEHKLDELHADERIKALAIRSAKTDSFVVGADIGELAQIHDADDAREKSRIGHRIFGRIASLPVPTVAVIHGACLGGGMEMSLACDYRLVTDHPKTSLGLPEVNLGIIPGWGGTQRLPRVIGLAAALGLVVTGKAVPGRKAYRLGLADGLVAEPFHEEQTRRFVDRVLSRNGRRAVERRRRRARPLPVRLIQATAIGRRWMGGRAEREVMKKTKGQYPAPIEAARLMARTGGRTALSDGLDREAEVFSRLAGTPVSQNLVRLFQASQRMKKSEGKSELSIATAGVLGAGIMGSGIAWAAGRAGLSVRLRDLDWDCLASGMARIAKMNESLVKRRRMTKGDMSLAMHRVSPSVELDRMRDVDIVIEAVAEDIGIKVRVLQELESVVRPDTIICTNTSSLSLTELASSLRYPKRFVGLHFFNPVNRMKLVEVVPGRKTSRDTILAAVDLVRRMDKLPVVVGDCAGFLVNRILVPYLVESAWMVEQGVAPAHIDRTLEQFGMPMGPLTLIDEVGLDIGGHVARVLHGAYGERMAVAGLLDDVAAEDGLLGKKSGRGFYLYENGHQRPNPLVTELAERARDRDGLATEMPSDDDIVDRAVLIMVNEAARCLEEGVVTDPSALDTAMVMGTGFAPHRGGVLRYADERGLPAVRDRLEELAVVHGDRFRPAGLIERMAARDGRFEEVA